MDCFGHLAQTHQQKTQGIYRRRGEGRRDSLHVALGHYKVSRASSSPSESSKLSQLVEIYYN